jgi:hypothetical protein
MHYTIKVYYKAESMDFKNLLVLDNVAVHRPVIEVLYRHTDAAFLPHTMTPLFQPMNQAIIPTFKPQYF